MHEHLTTDVLVIGGGGAGMYAALAAADAGASVLLVDKNLVGRGGATIMAQMTVAAALGDEEPDSIDLHIEDTLGAGRDLCIPVLAELVCREGPKRIREMDGWGVGWARSSGGEASVDGPRLKQVMAPGHSRKRCCYVDILNTGPAVAATLRRKVARESRIRRLSGVTIAELVVDNATVHGARGINVDDGCQVSIAAKSVVIATGGLTRLYSRTSASNHMSGEGYALALEAGAELIDMEFVQFFPIGHLAPRLVGMDPIMWDPFRYKLGGELLNGAMEPFLERYGELEEDNYTVTRDLATYAILSEVEAGRGSPAGGAYLSFMHKSERELREAFGPVIDTLASNGIDLLARPVEVSPIAHYHMGGVRVDESMASRVPGLFAAGEAVGGASGANRLSGNAITEAFVFGHTAGVSAARFALARSHGWRSSWDGSVSALRGVETHTASSHDIESAPLHYLSQLRRRMWDDVGPFRNADSLARTVSWLDEVRSDVLERLSIGSAQAFANDVIDWCELRAALTTAECVAKAALAREESRGAHQRDDFPGLDPEWSRHQSVVLDGEDMAVAAQPKGAF